MDVEQAEPIRWWPFAQAPEEFRRDDNGGDEDWVLHIPASWIVGPMPRCSSHGRDFVWDCRDCEDARTDYPQLRVGHINFDALAVCSLDFYEQTDGSVVCITHHA